MCHNCLLLAKKYFPEMSDEDLGALLYNLTGFPYAEGDVLEDQLKHIKEVGIDEVLKERDSVIRMWLENGAK